MMLSRTMLSQLKQVLTQGSTGAVRHCPICGREGRFVAFMGQRDARCPDCGGLSRHRFLKLVIDREPIVRGRVLHFAPEAAVSSFLRPRAEQYVTADLMQEADLKIDIEAIDQPDGSFDTIICSHVLEHVDDRRALAELRRILAPGGLAILAVPIVEGWSETYEDASITRPEDRWIHFGQGDHVRIYGRDFRDRVRGAGFRLEERVTTGAECARYALARGETIFLAWRDP